MIFLLLPFLVSAQIKLSSYSSNTIPFDCVASSLYNNKILILGNSTTNFTLFEYDQTGSSSQFILQTDVQPTTISVAAFNGNTYWFSYYEQIGLQNIGKLIICADSCFTVSLVSDVGSSIPTNFVFDETFFAFAYTNTQLGGLPSYSLMSFSLDGFLLWEETISNVVTTFGSLVRLGNGNLLLVSGRKRQKAVKITYSLTLQQISSSDQEVSIASETETLMNTGLLASVVALNQEAVFAFNGDGMLATAKIVRFSLRGVVNDILDLSLKYLSAVLAYDEPSGILVSCGAVQNMIYLHIISTGKHMTILSSTALDLALECKSISLDIPERKVYAVVNNLNGAKVWNVSVHGLLPPFKPYIYSDYTTSSTQEQINTNGGHYVPPVTSNTENFGSAFGMSTGGAVALIVCIFISFAICFGFVYHYHRKAEKEREIREQIRLERKQEKKRRRKERSRERLTEKRAFSKSTTTDSADVASTSTNQLNSIA